MKKMHLIYIVFSLILLSACDSHRVYDKNIDFVSSEWFYKNTEKFEVKIDNLSPKNIFINFRHSSFFMARNVLMKLSITKVNGESETININMPLSEPNGVWYGDCNGDICFVQHPIDYIFQDTGIYIFEFTQNMRVNPLKEVLSVGLRVEKSEVNKPH